MKLGISTGSFWKPGRWFGHNQAIRKIAKLKVKNIELCLIDFEDTLANFNLLPAKKDLKKFKTIGIHLPAFYYSKNKDSKFVTKVMHYIYKKTRAKYAVVHVNWIKDPYWLKKRKWNVLIENATGHQKIGHRKFINYVKKHRLNALR